MSVDPLIQSPTNSQSINPYSYIMNNPLSGIDPTGYCSTDDTMKGCADGLENGETQAITNADGDTVGYVGKDNQGNIHMTNNGSSNGQAAVVGSMNKMDIGAQNNISKQSPSGGFMEKASGFFKQLGQSFLDSQAQELAGGMGFGDTDEVESSIQFPMDESEVEGAEAAEAFMSNADMAVAAIATVVNLRKGDVTPSKELIMGSLSMLVKDGAIDASVLKSFVPESIKNDFFPTDRVPAGQSFRFKVGDTKVHLKWHSPDLAMRQKYRTSNLGRVWTAQIKVGRHYLLTNGHWSARKGIQKSNRAHIPVFQR
ncbi:hypothetical protein [Pseudoalteromonas lipolytica]|uniref:hypothetical protein n=1 Tax=Pseudoalteromonas lipolytica TaxID=570156 RepID=UPI0020B73014